MNDFQYADAHVHTSYSRNDCKQPMDGYLDLLRSGKAIGFGFADHLHPPREALTQRYPSIAAYTFDGNGYTTDILAAKDEGLNVHAGIEITYDHIWDDVCTRRALDNDYDYRIASIHSMDGLWITRNYWQNVEPGTVFLDIVNRYYDAILHALEVPWADVVAHIGVYRRFLPDAHPLMVYANDLIARREDEVAKACALSDKIIEVNTSGLFKPGACTMPNDVFLTHYKKYGGEKLYLSSDAHDVQNANQGFARAAQRLQELGFDKLYPPWSKGPYVAL